MKTKPGKPFIPDVKTILQAGVDPATGLPIKITSADGGLLKQNYIRLMRIIDRQDACNRYKWYNLPANVSSQELERLLYYKGQLCFFYEKTTEKFYFMPYALDGTIDFYGRYNRVHPVPYSSGGEDEKTKRFKTQLEYLSTLKLDCLYAIPTDEEVYDHPENYCVLLWDYTRGLGENIVARSVINETYIDLESDILTFMRTALLSGTGIKGMRVNSADEEQNVNTASKSLLESARKGQPWTPIISPIEFQELTDGKILNAQEYLISLQSIENQRLASYGLDNGGIFEKKAHKLAEEQVMNQGNNGVVFQDGLQIRQNFCDIVNAIWGLGIDCQPTEAATEFDANQDGLAYDENEGQTSVEIGGGSNDIQDS